LHQSQKGYAKRYERAMGWDGMGWDGMEPVAVDGAGSGAGAGPMATDVASLLKSSQFGAHRSRR